MKDQKKWELLKFAYDNYPKGTNFISHSSEKKIAESSGEFRIAENSEQGFWVTDNITNWVLYHRKKNGWAEIVKPKIAVKVENEKEFKALMKYYDSLGYGWRMGHKATEHTPEETFPLSIGIENNNKIMNYVGEFKDVQRIPFSDFAKDHNIKLPLLTSEDGVDLYEGDECYIVDLKKRCFLLDEDKLLLIIEKGSPVNSKKGYVHSTDIDNIEYSAYKEKQFALDWIEAQKPKEMYLHIGSNTLTIKSNNVSGLDKISWLSDNDIEAIYKSMQELS